MGILKLLLEHMKIVKTSNLYLTFFILGIVIAIPGPCLIDLQHLVKTDTHRISIIYVVRSTGCLLGTAVGGLIFDILKSKHLLLAASCGIAAGTMFGIPWSRDLGSLIGCMAINGFCIGVLENGSSVLCLTLWGKGSNPILQGLHFIFGVGGLVAPLIAAPFLEDNNSSDAQSGDNDTSLNEIFLNNSTINFTTSNSSATQGRNVPGITYTFSIIGVFIALVTVMILAVFILSPTEEKPEDDEKKENSERSWKFMTVMVILNAVLIFIGTGLEIAYAQMVTSYAVKGPLHLHPSTGSYVTSAFWAAFTVSRLVSVFLAIKFKSLTLILADITLVSIAAAVLLFLMPSEWALWLASVIYGMGIASFYPAVVGWVNEHVYVTNKVASFFTFGAAAGEMVVPFIISCYIESVPEIFEYFIAAACVVCFIFVFIMYMFFKHYNKKIPEKAVEICVTSTSSI